MYVDKFVIYGRISRNSKSERRIGRNVSQSTQIHVTIYKICSCTIHFLHTREMLSFVNIIINCYVDQNGCHFFPRFGCPFHQRTYFHESPKHCYIIVSFHQMNLDVKEHESFYFYFFAWETALIFSSSYFDESCFVVAWPYCA